MTSAAAAIACIGQPVSWLRLERYALQELDGAGAAAVRSHLDDCAACRAALATIEGDADAGAGATVLPPLPAMPLPVFDAERSRAARDELADRRARSRSRWRRGTLATGLGVAVAAAAVLLLWLRAPGDDGRAGRHARVKGAGTVTLRLVRERAGVIAFDPADVAPDDRWKVELTCSNPGPLWTDVVVYQRGAASFPLPAQPIGCGNQVAVPGAFRITDGGATICVALGAAPAALDRTRLGRAPRGPIVCASVTEARAPQ